MRDVADLFAVHKDAAIVLERFEKFLSGAYRHVRPLERCPSPAAASPRCFPACPPPHPPPPPRGGGWAGTDGGGGGGGGEGGGNITSARQKPSSAPARSSPPRPSPSGASDSCSVC